MAGTRAELDQQIAELRTAVRDLQSRLNNQPIRHARPGGGSGGQPFAFFSVDADFADMVRCHPILPDGTVDFDEDHLTAVLHPVMNMRTPWDQTETRGYFYNYTSAFRRNARRSNTSFSEYQVRIPVYKQGDRLLAVRLSACAGKPWSAPLLGSAETAKWIDVGSDGRCWTREANQ